MSGASATAGLAAALAALVAAPALAQGGPTGGPTGGPQVRATIVPGQARPPPAPTAPVTVVRSGDVSLNFPNADVSVVAKAVLGDLLGLQYAVSPDARAQVTLVTQKPVARADVFKLFEAAMSNAGLAVVLRDGEFTVMPLEQARAQAPVTNGGAPGFATETINLSFVNADELRRVIDPILPGVIVQADTGRNVIVVAGTSGQRAAVRDLIREFDVNWLRSTSFALYVPQRTDARLIVPELDKLINAPGAPTRGLVHLITMDSLNGILAVSTQPQYLEDVRRWIEVLDREGESSERRIFVYHVQNGRSADLAKVLANAFGRGAAPSETGRSEGQITRDDLNPSAAQAAAARSEPAPAGGLSGPGAATGAAGPGATSPLAPASAANGAGASGDVSVDIATEGLHAKISSDEANNAIVVYATPRDYAVIEDALRKLDTFPNQVLIEAAITEVTLTDMLRYGVQWQITGGGGPSSASLSEGTTASPVQNFPGFSYFYAGKSIQATLNALENLTTIKVVSAPKLQVLNNQTASLQVGDSVPVISGSSISTIGTNAPIVNSIDYRDIGIILKITPRVNSSGVVLLDVEQEVSDVVPTLTPGIASPTFSMRRITTSIAVQDGQVVALGGLISDSQTRGKNGLPFLSRIPILGPNLFGNNVNSGTKTELLVLLRPMVVRNTDEGRAVTEELKAKLQSLRPMLPPTGVP